MDPLSFCACNEREICWNLLDSVTSCVTGVGTHVVKGGGDWSVHFKANKNQMWWSDTLHICTGVLPDHEGNKMRLSEVCWAEEWIDLARVGTGGGLL